MESLFLYPILADYHIYNIDQLEMVTLLNYLKYGAYKPEPNSFVFSIRHHCIGYQIMIIKGTNDAEKYTAKINVAEVCKSASLHGCIKALWCALESVPIPMMVR